MKTRVFERLAIVLAVLLVHSAAAGAEAPGARALDATDIRDAARTSRITTAVVTIGGLGLCYATGNGTGSDFTEATLLTGVVGSLGAIAGPSAGWFMRGQPARAWSGIALRTTGAVLLVSGLITLDEDGNGTALAIVGGTLLAGSLAWDLVTVGKPSEGPPLTSIRLEPVLIGSPGVAPGFGWAASARF